MSSSLPFFSDSLDDESSSDAEAIDDAVECSMNTPTVILASCLAPPKPIDVATSPAKRRKLSAARFQNSDADDEDDADFVPIAQRKPTRASSLKPVVRFAAEQALAVLATRKGVTMAPRARMLQRGIRVGDRYQADVPNLPLAAATTRTGEEPTLVQVSEVRRMLAVSAACRVVGDRHAYELDSEDELELQTAFEEAACRYRAASKHADRSRRAAQNMDEDEKSEWSWSSFEHQADSACSSVLLVSPNILDEPLSSPGEPPPLDPTPRKVAAVSAAAARAVAKSIAAMQVAKAVPTVNKGTQTVPPFQPPHDLRSELIESSEVVGRIEAVLGGTSQHHHPYRHSSFATRLSLVERLETIEKKLLLPPELGAPAERLMARPSPLASSRYGNGSLDVA